MPSGGARIRSGPAPDPRSGRSESRGITLNNALKLDARGYHGKFPAFPLAFYKIYTRITRDDESFEIVDKKRSEDFNRREAEVWEYLWTLPQAAAWYMPQYQYLTMTIALYCRQIVLCESSTCTSADRTTLQRYADILGLSPAGLRALNWVLVDETAEEAQASSKPKLVSSKSRIRRS